ncbi:MAG: arylesterase [Arenicella sp.]
MSMIVSKKCLHKITLILICLIFSFGLISPSYSQQEVSEIQPSKHILVFGDSLSAAFGIDIEQGWVHLLEQYLNNGYSLKQQGKTFFQISNASISGETTTGGLARLELTLEEFKPDMVLLALGANDGLQGHPLEKIEKNLNSMLDIIQNNGIQAVVFGISIPASYGPRYIDKFRDIFPNVAQQRGLPFFDLYQENFFLQPGYMQKDGLHPTAIGQPIIRDLIADFLEQQKLLENTKE